MTMGDQSYRSNADATPNDDGKYVTYKALPCPLPKAWADELKLAEADDGIVGVLAVESRCRAALGFQMTRKYIPPVVRP